LLPTRSMKATDLLQKQHREVEAIFAEISAMKSDPTELLTRLANTLAAHMAIEQDIFYPAVREVDKEAIDESFEEHAIAELALKRLLATPVRDPSFEAKVIVLEELIEHHVDEEEDELFPEIEEKLGAAKLEELGRKMEEAFQDAMKQGFAALAPPGLAKTSADEARTVIASQAPQQNGPRAPGPR
jgi:iron-sulfur cluster repair protein YtfE (RIC family)